MDIGNSKNYLGSITLEIFCFYHTEHMYFRSKATDERKGFTPRAVMTFATVVATDRAASER